MDDEAAAASTRASARPEADRARTEQLLAAERRGAQVRLAVVVFNVVAYFAFMDPQGTRPWLATLVAAVSITYTVGALALEELRAQQIQLTAMTTTVLDGGLIALWILATGGWSSPFYLLLYVSIVGVAFRYSVDETVVATILYSIAYALIAVVDGGAPDPTGFGIRLVYIAFVAAVAINLSEEVSEQTHQRFQMEKLADRAREAKERFRRLLEAAPDAILILDERGRVEMANDRAFALFGLAPAELTGRRLAQLVTDLPPEADASQPSLGIHDKAVEAAVQPDEGGPVPIELSLAPLETADETLWIAIVRDIRERKQTQATLRERAQALERSNEELEQFAHVAAHDLQEPLRSMASFAQLIEHRYREKLDAEGEEYIDYMVDGAERMQAIIRDLLAFAEVDRAPVTAEPVDLDALVTDILDALTVDRQVQAHVDALPTVRGRPGQLRQVLQNLISNAIKFQQDQTPEIWVLAEAREDEWVIAVEDDGIGIEPAYRERVFEMFERLGDRASFPGTGMGLAIARKIVEHHGGEIWIEDAQHGTGTRVVFTLPIEPEQLGSDESPAEDDRGG